VELLSAIERQYNVELNETAFADAKTIEDVQRLLQQPATRRTDYEYPLWTQREPVRWFRLLFTTPWFGLRQKFWATRGCWPRAFEGRAWAGDCDFESHHAARGYWLDSGGSAGALPAPAATAMGGENSGAHAKAAERMVFRKTVGV